MIPLGDAAETEAFGQRLADGLRAGDVVALYGALGAESLGGVGIGQEHMAVKAAAGGRDAHSATRGTA